MIITNFCYSQIAFSGQVRNILPEKSHVIYSTRLVNPNYSGPCISAAYLEVFTPDTVFLVSTRHINLSYSGPCMEVRRSNDNQVQNIGFVGGVIDTNSLKSFVGSGNGFVTKFYNQYFKTGRVHSFFQNTANSQPLIVSNGAVQYIRTTPAVLFGISTSRHLRNDTLVIPEGVNRKISVSYRNITYYNYGVIWSNAAANNYGLHTQGSFNGTYIFIGATRLFSPSYAITDSTYCLLEDQNAFLNGGANQVTVLLPIRLINGMTLGGLAAGQHPLNGLIEMFCLETNPIAISDIGFLNGVLDTVQLRNLIRAENQVRVYGWYDQSGNGRNAIQPQWLQMPTILNNDNVIRYNRGLPALKFNFNGHMDASDVFIQDNTPSSVYSVSNFDSRTSFQVIWSNRTTNNYGHHTSASNDYIYTGAGYTISPAPYDTTSRITAVTSRRGYGSGRRTIPTNSHARFNGLRIGAQPSGTERLNGTISEFVISKELFFRNNALFLSELNKYGFIN